MMSEEGRERGYPKYRKFIGSSRRQLSKGGYVMLWNVGNVVVICQGCPNPFEQRGRPTSLIESNIMS